MAISTYGLDIGTSSFKMCHDGKILNEKNVIAIKQNEMVAFGDEAYDMFEKSPDNISIIFPVKYGVIADIDNMLISLQAFFKKMNDGKKQSSVADIYISVPRDLTSVEKRAFFELVYQSRIKARDILIVDEPIAAAVGAGVDVLSTKASLIVDIGSDTTELSIISNGGIILSQLIDTGTVRIDEAIISEVRKEYNLLIGKKTGQKLKEALATAIAPQEAKFALAFGRNLLSGLPVSCKVTQEVVYKASKEAIHIIMEDIRNLLDRIPAEIAKDLLESGLYLLGGGSRIANLKEYFEQALKMKVNLVEVPEQAVIRGLDAIATKDEFYDLASVPNDEILGNMD